MAPTHRASSMITSKSVYIGAWVHRGCAHAVLRPSALTLSSSTRPLHDVYSAAVRTCTDHTRKPSPPSPVVEPRSPMSSFTTVVYDDSDTDHIKYINALTGPSQGKGWSPYVGSSLNEDLEGAIHNSTLHVATITGASLEFAFSGKHRVPSRRPLDSHPAQLALLQARA